MKARYRADAVMLAMILSWLLARFGLSVPNADVTFSSVTSSLQ